jgi:hypothetical protein
MTSLVGSSYPDLLFNPSVLGPEPIFSPDPLMTAFVAGVIFIGGLRASILPSLTQLTYKRSWRWAILAGILLGCCS